VTRVPARCGALVAVIVAALALAAPALAVAPRTSLTTVEPQVMCVVCKLPLNVAESAQADRERVFIQSLIVQGLTVSQIKVALIAQYGPSVIATPSTHGFGLVAYIVPIVVVLGLVALVIVLLPRWRRHDREQPQPPLQALAAEDRDRLDAELARYPG
jgi:cytochrome c-type biogenesis protein CcmH